MGITPDVISFEQALAIVQAESERLRAEPPVMENLPLLQSSGRVLAMPIVADRDQPPFHRSTRDGFAVQAEALSAPATILTVIGQLRAGKQWVGSPLEPHQAVEIMTGAPLPPGADAVLMLEHIQSTAAGIKLAQGRSIRPGDNVVHRGSEARAGEAVISPGTRISASEIALAASFGYTHLLVSPRPKVAVVATGDELVELNEVPGPEQIRNSNSYALAGMVSAAGGHPDRLPVARDVRQDVHAAIERGRMADLLILSGGVSMGAYDLVEEVLTESNAEFFFTGVALQPGKPAVFGRLPPSRTQPACWFFGLPGNPISTQVTFHAFVEPFLRALGGELNPRPRWAQATLAHPIPARPHTTRLLPGSLQGVEVSITPWQGSGDLAANARANCYVELLPSVSYAGGEVVRILLR